MPIDSILVSVAVVTMFLVFAVALAWAQYQTESQQNNDDRSKRRSF